MVDRELILRKLADLELYVDQVSEYRGIDVEGYLADWKVQRIVERTLQMAIETCADVVHHLISDRALRIPTTYAEAFEVLGEAGILDPSLGRALIAMTGFRNVLVHEYARVDSAIVLRILREHLGDFARFGEAIRRQI